MKRRIITTVAVCVFLALVLAVRLSDREKIDNSIPSKETVAAYILEKGEQYAAEQLRAQDRDSLRRSWCVFWLELSVFVLFLLHPASVPSSSTNARQMESIRFVIVRPPRLCLP